jgi:hypothetical protein
MYMKIFEILESFGNVPINKKTSHSCPCDAFFPARSFLHMRKGVTLSPVLARKAKKWDEVHPPPPPSKTDPIFDATPRLASKTCVCV